MDKQELINILKSQSETFSEDVERKLEYLNSDEVFSEYTQDLDEDLDDESVDSETLKKQKLAAKIAAMRGLSAPQFLKK